MKQRSAALLFAAATTSAVAVSQPAAAADFVGPRAEVTVGADQLKFDLGSVGTAGSRKAHGVSIGGTLGYDVPLGGLIAGVEAGISKSTADRTFSDGTNSLTVDAGRDIELSGRIGAPVGPRTLLYGKAGYTNLRIGSELDLAGVTTNSKTNLVGYRLGVGIEQGLGANTFAKAEYRYSNYEQDIAKNELLAGFGIRF